MKLIKTALILGLGGVALRAFTRQRSRAAWNSASPKAAVGAGQADRRPTRTSAAADSPNAAERLQSRQPTSGMAGNDRLRASLLDSDAARGESARATGLADFTRGA